MATAKVDTKHPDYDGLQAQRDVIADLRGGTDAMRAKSAKYLKKYHAELSEDYEIRVSTATLFNVYAKTEEVMTGLVFKEEIDTSGITNATIAGILENFDNKGNSFNEFARTAFAHSFDGAAAILVDAPTAVEGVRSLEDVRRMKLRPYAVLYPQSSVVNWRYQINPVSKSRELSMIVFCEKSNEPDGDFGWQKVERYRVFRLDIMTRAVTWQLWRETEGREGDQKEFVLEAEGMMPSAVTEIPVAIIGDLSEPPPLMNLAHANVKHFQKESSFDSLEFLAGVPMLKVKGRNNADEPLIVAANAVIDLNAEGDAEWVQIDSSGFGSLRDSLAMLLDQMSLMGLSMLADKTARVDLTATEALLKNIGETAALRVMANDLKDAFERTLQYFGWYLGLGEDSAGEIVMGTAWAVADREAEAMKQKMQGATATPQTGAAAMVN